MQLLVDLISTKLIDKIGYRVGIVTAHIFASVGLVSLAVLPEILPSPYAGTLISVVLYAIGGGLIEVMISPIVEACPTEKKEAAMSLLHSFYCWGHMAVVIISTLFFSAFGIDNWRILSILWAVIPAVNCVYFSFVPLYPITGNEKPQSVRGLMSQRIFWILMVLMVCAGASEQAMSQWASVFAESALKIPKSAGDLAGPCAFALMMGTARAIYGKYSDKLPLKKAMTICSALCIGSYLLAALTRVPVFALAGCAVCGFSVGIFWPGTFSLSAACLPSAGTAMYALMALAGDVGCSAGPTIVGMIADKFGGELRAGLLAALVFPVAILINMVILNRKNT